ncbi:ABC transporter substrate-binding protein [Palleronia abyssalis]|uniref:Multiple sugar-binding protein n=1 Tax=Palleronia abyssalis TaxID=1501240 RepID=A0A2R8C0Z8_9RHOB|nr:extracellular solute-binding protein [Palleronia abyssalis]SPJ26093.1 Multiple sugar-binding protein [Palleronia abyssalis]
MKTKLITSPALAAVLALSGGAAWAQDLTILSDSSPDTVATLQALGDAYSEMNPDVSFSIETRPGGGEGDNVVKTRLATGEMADIFQYNSGSLLQNLRPSRTLAPMTDLPAMDNLLEGFKTAVSGPEGEIYGVPIEAAMGGGIFYHIPTYEELGLEVPLTWDQFMENNRIIAEQTDKAPIIQTYRETWTSQLLVLADYFNVQVDNPDFAQNYTAGEAKYAETPEALRSFGRLQEAAESGYFNEDFGAASYADGLAMLASGEGVHYPMLTFAIGALSQDHPEELSDIGFFAQPGDDPEQNGLTVWMPSALYVPADTDNLEVAKDFMNFVATPEGCRIIFETVGASGPAVVEGCELPDDVPPSVSDMQKYFDEEGRTAPALEYVSPVKGPSLEQITVAVGSGINTAEEGASLYDQDAAKQARQLGLEGW